MPRPKKTERLPVIPLRDMVVFPHSKVPFIVGRASSVEAVKAAVAATHDVVLAMQRDASVREPGPPDLHDVGTLGRIVHHARLPDGTWKLLVEGRHRVAVTEVAQEHGHLVATATPLTEVDEPSQEREALLRRLATAWDAHARLQQGLALEPVASLLQASEAPRASDELVARLSLAASEKQEILATLDVLERLRRLDASLQVESDRVRLDQKLQRQVEKQVESAQREYLLNEKMKAIQKELGRKGDAPDSDELMRRVEEAGLPTEAHEKATAEVRRLESMPPMSAEATVVRGYLDWILALPWTKRTRERKDFDRAAAILDEDHHGLERIKERILEFLAVRTLQKGSPPRGSLLCLVGPPGVGKTSLGRSIARATGRRFVRLSLGGVRDEAEIRGHRRTYIGAYPGRIIQMMRKAGTRNPVFLLDEIDKLASDFRGDPAAALLEVLDPEQNREFLDHYLDVGFDLSEVMFVCTANVAHAIPEALRDRLELVRLAGYTLREKMAIAERFLVPRQIEDHGLDPARVSMSREAIESVIECYTREAGVRSLEREIASICRKAATRAVRSKEAVTKLDTLDDVRALLGVPRYRTAVAERQPEVGVATGLAWTEQGGQILQVEATRMRGSGKLTITGQLGDVMKESLQAALSYVRSRSDLLPAGEDALKDQDVHVHVPEGAIPKDGPSAGITMATALASALSGRPVRHDLAMTGEITLRGRVLPVGGVKEKLLAAHRLGLLNVIVPAENARDLEEVPADVRAALSLSFVSNMDEVLDIALLPRVAVAEVGVELLTGEAEAGPEALPPA